MEFNFAIQKNLRISQEFNFAVEQYIIQFFSITFRDILKQDHSERKNNLNFAKFDFVVKRFRNISRNLISQLIPKTAKLN